MKIMNETLFIDRREAEKARILAILGQLNVPESQKESWLLLWSKIPESKWDSTERLWARVWQNRDLTDGAWKVLQRVFARRTEQICEDAREPAYDLEERNGCLFERETRQVWESKRLNELDYEILVNEEQWELFRAVCYLVGYTAVGEDTFCGSSQISEVEIATKKARQLYEIVVMAAKKGDLRILGNIDDYPDDIHWARPGKGKCFVAPYDFLKWVLLRDFYIPVLLQSPTGLFLHENSQHSLKDQPQLQFRKNSDNWNVADMMDRLACQSIAQVLWYFNPLLANASVEKEIRQDSFFRRLTNASLYRGKDTLWKWIKAVDPRNKIQRGRQPKQTQESAEDSNRLRWRSIDCASYFEVQREGEPDYWSPAYSFRKFKQVIFCSSCALFYKANLGTREEVFAHPIIEQYLGLKSEFCEKMMREWIDEAHSFKIANS
jgi:hypothetical protein